MNPAQAFLTEKHGSFGSLVHEQAKQMPEVLSSGVMQGLAGALAVGATAGVGIAAAKLYDAATKGRDFRRMISFNPDLATEHERDPRVFNQLYSSLRSINPTFARDPIIAGSYMRRMVGSPMAGGVLTDALSFKDKARSPMEDLIDKGILEGAKGGLRHQLQAGVDAQKHQHEQARFDTLRQDRQREQEAEQSRFDVQRQDRLHEQTQKADQTEKSRLQKLQEELLKGQRR